MKKSIRNAIIIAVSLLLLSCTGCGKSSETHAAKEKLVVNYAGSYSNVSIAIIKQEGLLEKYLPDETEVEWTNLAAAADMRDGILSGNIDIAGYAMSTYMMGLEAGLPLVMIANECATPIKLYSNEERIQGLSDFLETDKISMVGLGTILHIALLAEMNEEGLAPESFDDMLTVMPHADGLAALSGGTGIQGLVLTFPMTIKADATSSIHEICDFKDVVLQYGIGCVDIVSQDLYDNYPEIIEAFLNAKEEAIQLCKTDSERIANILAKEWEIDAQIILEVLNEMPPAMEITGFDKQAEILHEVGLVKELPKAFSELDNYEELLKLQGK